MASGTPDEKFQKLREENERRRKKKEEEEKRRKQDEDQKAKEALERRRQERLEQDERMRKPWQQPPAPKKPILRKGAKQKPVQASKAEVDPLRQSQAEEKRREWRQGLQDFIKQQRQQAVAAAKQTPSSAGPSGGGAADGTPVVPLTWEELRMAAEAGFDELLKQQELQAEQRAAEEPTSRAARHRSPYKSPFRGAPAPPQETVQVALVPTQQITGNGVAASPAAMPPRPSPRQGQNHGTDHVGLTTAVAESSRFSDLPSTPPDRLLPQQAPGYDGGVAGGMAQATGDAEWRPEQHALDAATGESRIDGQTAAVLYPPGTADNAAGRGSWADGFVGLAGDAHGGSGSSVGGSGHGTAGSVGNSGGLRRGVTSTARHRAAPVNPLALDVAGSSAADGATDPWLAPSTAEGGFSPLQRAGSPRGSLGQRPPLPGPYDVPSQQQWPPPPLESPSSAVSQQRSPALPAPPNKPSLPEDPLEASLQAGGTLAALQQADGFRMSSPRPAGQPRPQPQPQQQCEQPPQAQRFQVASHDHSHTAVIGPEAVPPLPLPPQQQQPGRADQRHQRRVWGVPAQPPTRPQPDGEPTPPPPWLLDGSVCAAAPTGPPRAASGDRHSSQAGTDMQVGVGEGRSVELPTEGAAMMGQARSPATMRHSVAVGDSGGPDMWQRESVAVPVRAAAAAVDASADLVRFSSPPGPSTAPSSAEPSPAAPSIGSVSRSQASVVGDRSQDLPHAELQQPIHQPQQQQQLQAQQSRQRISNISQDGGPLVESAGMAVAAGYKPVTSPTAAMRTSVADSSTQAPAQLSPQAPMLPPIAPGRPPPGSAARLSGSGSIQGGPSGPFPPLLTSVSQPPMLAEGYPHHLLQPPSSAEQPQLPPFRAPSPPASPPRSSGASQRYHRQHSTTSLLAGFTPGPGGVASGRARSSDGQRLSTAGPSSSESLGPHTTTASAPPSPPEQRQQSPGRPQALQTAAQQPGEAVYHAAASPVSPRRPGFVSMTPASPSAASGRPAAPAPHPELEPGSTLQARLSAEESLVRSSGARTVPPTRGSADRSAAIEPPVAPSEPSEGPRWTAAGPPGSGAVGSPAREIPEECAQLRREGETDGEDLDGDVELEEEVEEEEASDGFSGRVGGAAGRSAALEEDLERPPGTAEASILTGSHISARPWSGPSTGPGGGRMMGSGYQAAVLEDSTSSFDFRGRSAGASRPVSATSSCGPPSSPSPAQLSRLYPGAVAAAAAARKAAAARQAAAVREEEAAREAAAQETAEREAAAREAAAREAAAREAAAREAAAREAAAREAAAREAAAREAAAREAAAREAAAREAAAREAAAREAAAREAAAREAAAREAATRETAARVAAAREAAAREAAAREAAAREAAARQAAAREAAARETAAREAAAREAAAREAAAREAAAREAAAREAAAQEAAAREAAAREAAAREAAMAQQAAAAQLTAAAAQRLGAAAPSLDARSAQALDPPSGSPDASEAPCRSEYHPPLDGPPSRLGPGVTHGPQQMAVVSHALRGAQPTGISGTTAAASAVAPNAFQVLNRPGVQAVACGGLYGVGDDCDGPGQPFEEELVDEPSDEHYDMESAAHRTSAPGGTPSTSTAAVGRSSTSGVAVSPDPDLDALMREIQELSALRKALKAEFEYMGHGEAVAGLKTLSANFEEPPRDAAAATAAAGAYQPGDDDSQAALQPQPQDQRPAPVAAPPRLQQVPTAPAPMLQWNIPGVSAAPAGPVVHTHMAQQPQVHELEPPPRVGVPMHPQQQQPVQQVHALLPQWQVQLQAGTLDQQAQHQQDQQQQYLPPTQQQHLPHPAVAPVAVAGAAVSYLGPPAPPPVAELAQFPQELVGQGSHSGWGAHMPVSMAAPGPAADGAADAGGSSFAFAAQAGVSGHAASEVGTAVLAGPVAVAPPVVPPPSAPAAAASAPPAMQWTIPVGPAGSGGAAAASPPAPSGARGTGAAVSSGGGSGTSTPRKAAAPASQPKRSLSGGGGGYASPAGAGTAALDSPGQGSGARRVSGTPTQTAGAAASMGRAAGGAAAAAAAAPVERPQLNEGSYAQAAVQARERAERERAAREALQAESAAAKAAIIQRSKSERSQGPAVPGASASPSGKEPSPLGLKAPSTIGSYVRQPSPARPRNAAGDSGASILTAASDNPDSSPAVGSKQAWGAPSSAGRSRIPTPPRMREPAAAAPAPPAPAAPPAAATPPQPTREDSLDSDFDFLERATDTSDSETESPEAYGVSSKASPRRPPRREAFASPSMAAAAAAASGAACRERLAEARPQPLRIPSSVAATPMGGASTASTVASRAVPTGGRGPSGAAGAGGRGLARPGGRGPSTPFTAAIRELMGLPGSAPLEASRAAAVKQQQALGARGQMAHGHGHGAGAAADGGPIRLLSDEEDKLLASLKRLDADILRRGLMAAGIIHDPQPAPAAPAPTAASKPAGRGAKVKGKTPPAAPGAAVPGAFPLTNSLQQDQLRESLERLDVRLAGLRQKMEDRACTLGGPSVTAAGAGSYSAAPGVPSAGPGGARQETTPPREERRGPPATLAKSKTPTPNKAKAIRDQRQNQLSAAQGPTPPPARAPPVGAAAQPAKPVSAPTMGTVGGTPEALHAQHQPAAPGAAAPGSQPLGMPPRAPPAKAPASAPSGPAAANAALQQQQQYQQQMMAAAAAQPSTGGMPYGMMPVGMAFAAPGAGGAGPVFPHQPNGMMFAAPQQQLNPGGSVTTSGAQQVAYVPAMLPNGQMAFVPQYVQQGGAAPGGFSGFLPGAGPGGAFSQGGPQVQPQQRQPQQPFMSPQQLNAPTMPMMMVGPGQGAAPGGAPFQGSQMMQHHEQQPYLAMGGGPMLAWGAGHVAATPQPFMPHNNGVGSNASNPTSPSLYSFDRSGSVGHGNAHSVGGSQDPQMGPVGGFGNGQPQQQPQQPQQQQPQQQALPFAMGPPPTGPMPHYHSTVMRSRSIGSRDGETLAAAAAAMGLGTSKHHPSQQQQPPSSYSQEQTPGGDAASQQGQGQPHPVQVQAFGPNGSTRGLGPGGAWSMGANGPGVGGSPGPDAGVIKAVNLGLLLS